MLTIDARLRGKTPVHSDRDIFFQLHHTIIELRPGENVPYYAVSALAKFLGDIVALVDDEVLVEDLEGLPPLQVCHSAWVAGLSCCCKEDRRGLGRCFGRRSLSRGLNTPRRRALGEV